MVWPSLIPLLVLIEILRNTVRYYANAQTKKQLQVLDLGDQAEDIQHYTWLMVEHNNTKEHDNIK